MGVGEIRPHTQRCGIWEGNMEAVMVCALIVGGGSALLEEEVHCWRRKCIVGGGSGEEVVREDVCVPITWLSM